MTDRTTGTPATEIDEWLAASGRELGLEGAAESEQGISAARALADVVDQHVDASAVAPTVFLLGVAAGRAADPPVAAHDFVDKLDALARSWNADTDRAAQPNDQERRA